MIDLFYYVYIGILLILAVTYGVFEMISELKREWFFDKKSDLKKLHFLASFLLINLVMPTVIFSAHLIIPAILAEYLDSKFWIILITIIHALIILSLLKEKVLETFEGTGQRLTTSIKNDKGQFVYFILGVMVTGIFFLLGYFLS